ncbi:hypothetical protein C8J56DRAFT_1048946 [Mycena floridula]|nr:hypothetical protein C8J56DRAFT_1048946 [Mycena floridula]
MSFAAQLPPIAESENHKWSSVPRKALALWTSNPSTAMLSFHGESSPSTAILSFYGIPSSKADEKGKYFKELSGEKARSYFRKFVKAWNLVHYPDHSTPVTLNRLGRQVTNGPSPNPKAVTTIRQHRSPLPSTADLVLAREREEEEHKAERSYKRKRDEVEDKERIGEMVGPSEEKADEALEVNESTLLGGGDSFKD